eukprot:9123295-Alexandrium_andersonii.AAC.1
MRHHGTSPSGGVPAICVAGSSPDRALSSRVPHTRWRCRGPEPCFGSAAPCPGTPQPPRLA